MKTLSALWHQLTEPLIPINDIEAYQQAKLLASLSLAVLIVSIIGIFFTAPSYSPQQIQLIIPIFAGLLLFLLPYYQSRRGQLQAASLTLAFIATILINGAALSIGGSVGRDILHYYILVTIFCSVFLKRQHIIIFLVAIVGLIFIFVSLNPILAVADAIRGPLAFNLFGTAFVSTFIGYSQRRNQQKQDLIKEREQHKAQLLIKQEQQAIMGQFIQAISHDLRTRLSLIGTNSFFIRKALVTKPPADKAINRLDNIQNVVQDIDEQISNLEMITNLTTAKTQKIRLIEILEDVVSSLQLKANSHDITIQTQYEFEAVVINCDYVHIFTVIKNLLDNAIIYSKAGDQVTVKAETDDNLLLVTMIDQGIGIAPQDRERIFDMFSKVEAARTTSEAGLGLGLSIAKLITETYGGTIHINSTPNQGSEFKLELPIVQLDQ
jgi:signal transduction histidine kinase